MSKKDEVFRRYEKLVKAAKKENPGNASDHKPGSCAHCLYYRPISSIAGASSPDVPTVRIRMCFARSL